jgi:hypothetical protein
MSYLLRSRQQRKRRQAEPNEDKILPQTKMTVREWQKNPNHDKRKEIHTTLGAHTQ